MKIIFLFLNLSLFSFMAFAQRNVILIIADDIGTDYFSFYEDHQDTVDVPNIRALLSKGIRFQNAMSNPVCSSTRSGILTGRYSFRNGVGNVVGGIGGSGALDTSEITIPRLLKIYNPNIAKANIGKWHLQKASPTTNLLFPNVLGFDHFEGPFIGSLPSYTDWTKYTNGVSSNVTNYATTENVDNAFNWVKTQNTKPFFLWLAFNAPHTPIHLPPVSLHTFTSLSGTTQDINNNPKSYFKAMLQALDTEIGRLFDSLQSINRLDSTDIIFIGDNGNTTRTSQIADTSRAKGTIYQYGVHVPFIISGPSVINPGRVSDALINTADIFATVLELFGYADWQSQIPFNKPVDSKSILPIIKNLNNQIRPWAFTEIFKVTPDSDDGKAMRNMDYKLIDFDSGHQEFYNLTINPGETNDLLAGTLTTTDIENYNFLCSEMTNMLGTENFCNSLVGINSINKDNKSIYIYPNPFTSQIRVLKASGDSYYKLIDAFGRLIYYGKNIEKQDFGFLSNGLYYLHVQSSSDSSILKLIRD